MKIFAISLIFIGICLIGYVLNMLFRFTDHDDNMDDEGGWK